MNAVSVTDSPCCSTFDERLLRRARGEFLEMPGLRLTFLQARRLWGLDEGTCARLLEALVDSGFLLRGPDQRYGRTFDGEFLEEPSQMAKAALRPSDETPRSRLPTRRAS